jgi:hypothetical protein
MAAGAQPFPSEVVGFNGPPIDPVGAGDVPAAMEMFQHPQFSGTTENYIQVNSSGLFNNNWAYRVSGFQSEGAAALEASFRWLDPADPDAWLRLTTFNGPVRPL